MSLYKCIVYDKYKNKKLLTLDLDSLEEVNNYANQNDLNIVKVNIKNEKVIKLKDKDLKLICKKISILLESGCEITKVLDILKSQSNKNIKNILSNISTNINKGNTISDSFHKNKFIFKFFYKYVRGWRNKWKLR